MRFRTALGLAMLFLVCVTLRVLAIPAPDRLGVSSQTSPPSNAPRISKPDHLTQSGKISSIGDAAFTLEITQGEDRKTIEFQVDGDTKVQGKLRVGSKATVEYRSEGGVNMAVHVVVTRASRFGTL